MGANEIFFGLITAAIIALVIFLIWFIVRLMETVRALSKFVETADQALKEASRCGSGIEGSDRGGKPEPEESACHYG